MTGLTYTKLCISECNIFFCLEQLTVVSLSLYVEGKTNQRSQKEKKKSLLYASYLTSGVQTYAPFGSDGKLEN